MKPAKRYSDLMSELLNELAEMTKSVDVPVGALVLDKNLEVIAKTFNNRVEKNDPTAHAEIEALRIAGQKLNKWRLDDCTLIVTLEPCQCVVEQFCNQELAALYLAHLNRNQDFWCRETLIPRTQILKS